ncbi:hypothetical protein LY78DRAFT_374540 [Colletotrichum sublineola]|uniref:Uncharacterized protein n=1 Tax=Colletotrichum sublineola TaxID=1173701 RepID=A0A066XEP3_COLSU|nr:hypothetical protein LY78DRAFT_374540 [Colletotrichum sublineola]KDN66114.1 hypothetical protein CSUB01_01565 [Colletotrichum sublineola]
MAHRDHGRVGVGLTRFEHARGNDPTFAATGVVYTRDRGEVHSDARRQDLIQGRISRHFSNRAVAGHLSRFGGVSGEINTRFYSPDSMVAGIRAVVFLVVSTPDAEKLAFHAREAPEEVGERLQIHSSAIFRQRLMTHLIRYLQYNSYPETPIKIRENPPRSSRHQMQPGFNVPARHAERGDGSSPCCWVGMACIPLPLAVSIGVRSTPDRHTRR